MKLQRSFLLSAAVAFSAGFASAGTLTYTCDPGIATATCSYLNSTIAGQYNGTFTNASANIYIQYGSTGLAQTVSAYNFISYSAYAAYLTTNASDALQSSAVSSLSNTVAPYGTGNVEITAALGTAIGVSGLYGVNAAGTLACNLGDAGCYNASVTITNNPGTPLYYDNIGGPEASNAYDFYAAVEHETDEVLGTSSCISTPGTLTDGCGGGTPSAVDLFRYNSAGSLAVNSSYTGLSGAPSGAYFSYDGGTTNGANSFVYNTNANGADYADFLNNCPAGPLSVQDAYGCPGVDAGLSILNDGGAEVNILNAVGYDLAAPEPGTMALFGLGLTAIALYRRRA
jgi:hypothetical protein